MSEQNPNQGQEPDREASSVEPEHICGDECPTPEETDELIREAAKLATHSILTDMLNKAREREGLPPC